ncbi:UPF0261 family protein [Cohnella sp. CFH 77786]|uniref:Tm-1-like ATP-binding domain-containing protein n=1 Tax=Cohnella sp. CFH 77786 TaxID=2662265 RepID=UPI001C60EF7C|nr:Tm-1-like ATP-binding domain-containing protein [Cohnella sp. CFH 77786]MBW5444806.1 UPF0261 family protein [Cohnella sp. CFH 77786]
MSKAILVGALDTKGEEFRYVRDCLHEAGVRTLTIDTGVLGGPLFPPDVKSEEVAAAGGADLAALRKAGDRGAAVAAMTAGIGHVVKRLLQAGEVGGVFGMGGTAGTTVGAAAMQAVPIGVPKLLVSTVASGNTRPYVGVKDVAMMYSVADIAGLNRLSARILRNGAFALAGMMEGGKRAGKTGDGVAGEEGRRMVGMTMFGVTTPCVMRIKERLEAEGFELLVFHATGTGGMAMEELVRSGFLEGVVDVTTTELADELVGGIFSAGPARLEAAGSKGLPQVVSVGAMDMVNFGPPETVPEKFEGRLFYRHNPTTTLMRTTAEENSRLGRLLAEKLNAGEGRMAVVFPAGGVSLLDMAGKPFNGPAERAALLEGIRSALRPDIPLIVADKDLNDPQTADLIAEQFIGLFRGQADVPL